MIKMKKVEFFEPAMCCESGTCGPNVDPELLRIKGIVALLGKNGIAIERHNLAKDPQAFLKNSDVQNLITQYGAEALPITIVEGKALWAYGFPSDQDFVDVFELSGPLAEKVLAFKEKKPCCCGSDGLSCGYGCK
jgi:hypothetical protein